MSFTGAMRLELQIAASSVCSVPSPWFDGYKIHSLFFFHIVICCLLIYYLPPVDCTGSIATVKPGEAYPPGVH